MITTDGIICDLCKKKVTATIDGLCRDCDEAMSLADKLASENQRLRQLNAELLAACETWTSGSRCFCYVSLPEKPCFYCQNVALIARAKEATS